MYQECLMGFEWNERKRETNLAKHGIDFVDACRIFDGPVVEKLDERKEYGEARRIALGKVEGVVLYAVYTWRGDVRRLISARRAGKDECATYYAALKRRPPEE